MGCKESKEREAPPASATAYGPSAHHGATPQKPGDTASKGAPSVAKGCVEDGVGVVEHPTTSNSQGVRTPVQTRHTEEPSLYEAALADTPRGTNMPTLKAAAAHTAPSLLADTPKNDTPTARATPAPTHSSHDGGHVSLAGSSPPLQQNCLTAAAPTDAPSPLSCPSTPVVSTPSATSPTLQVASLSAAPPSFEVAVQPSSRLLPPAPSDASTPAFHGRASNTRESGTSPCRRESSNLADSGCGDSCGPYSRGDLGGVAVTALMNSTSLLHTVASTQPPSAPASRSASVQAGGAMPAVVDGAAPLPVIRAPPPKQDIHAYEAENEGRGGEEEEVLSAPSQSATMTHRRRGVSSSPSPPLAKVGTSVSSRGAAATVITLSDERCSTGELSSSAPTQCPSAIAERVGEVALPPSLSSSPPSQRQQQPQQSSPPHTRSLSDLYASPRPRAPTLLLSPHRPSSAPTATSAAGGTLSMSAVIIDASDAPEDVPLPEMDSMFTISPLCTHVGVSGGSAGGSVMGRNMALLGSSTSVSGSALSSPPRQISGSAAMRSPAGLSAVAVDGDGVYMPNSKTAATAASLASASAELASPFTAHHHNRSHSLAASNTCGGASWFAPDANGSGTAPSIATAGAATANTTATLGSPFGTPPTNSELVRQINQPTTNIRSILRKRTGPAANGYGTPPAAADCDGATVTSGLGGSSVHSHVPSLSANNLGGSSSSPRLMGGDVRFYGAASSPLETAVRTDFVTSRYSTSDIDSMSPVGSQLHVLTPSPRGGGVGVGVGAVPHPRSPSGSCSQHVGAMGNAPLGVSGETLLSATASSSHQNTGSGAGNGAYMVEVAEAGGAMNDGGGGRSSSPVRTGWQCSPATPGGASPPCVPASCASLEPLSASKGGRGYGDALPSCGNGSNGGSSGAAADVSPAAVPVTPPAAFTRTSDEPPPDIMLASPPKRVHLIV